MEPGKFKQTQLLLLWLFPASTFPLQQQKVLREIAWAVVFLFFVLKNVWKKSEKNICLSRKFILSGIY